MEITQTLYKNDPESPYDDGENCEEEVPGYNLYVSIFILHEIFLSQVSARHQSVAAGADSLQF